jgi:hypothetical protein
MANRSNAARAPSPAERLVTQPTQPTAEKVELNSPEALARATAELRAMGIDDQVVFSGSAEEVLAYLDATEPPCASCT